MTLPHTSLQRDIAIASCCLCTTMLQHPPPTLRLYSVSFLIFSWVQCPYSYQIQDPPPSESPPFSFSKDFGLLHIIFHCIINHPPNILPYLPFKSRNNTQNLSWTPCLTPRYCSMSLQLLLPNYSNNLPSVIVFIVSLPLLFSFFRK